MKYGAHEENTSASNMMTPVLKMRIPYTIRLYRYEQDRENIRIEYHKCYVDYILFLFTHTAWRVLFLWIDYNMF